MEADQIRILYKYNSWANDRIFDAVSKLTTEQYTRDMQSSYSSVRDTLLHLISVEWIYQQRLSGASPRSLWSPSEFPTVSKLREKWINLDGEQMAFIDNIREEKLKIPITYINLAGKQYSYPLWQVLQHVVNHSTYHRGQVITMLRQLGAETVSTDFLLYFDVDNA